MICQTDQIKPFTQARSEPDGHRPGPIDNQNGSVMVLALMIMAIMMVIGISSSDTAITENFIIRNVGIHKENVNLVESALMRGLQEFMQIPDNDPDNFDPDISNIDWINNRTTAWTTGAWYNRGDASTMLNANNSINPNEDGIGANRMATLATRGEAANGGLRCAIVGWEPVIWATGGSSSLVVGAGAIWHAGRVLGEYVSVDAGLINDNGNGMLRMELGLRRQW